MEDTEKAIGVFQAFKVDPCPRENLLLEDFSGLVEEVPDQLFQAPFLALVFPEPRNIDLVNFPHRSDLSRTSCAFPGSALPVHQDFTGEFLHEAGAIFIGSREKQVLVRFSPEGEHRLSEPRFQVFLDEVNGHTGLGPEFLSLFVCHGTKDRGDIFQAQCKIRPLLAQKCLHVLENVMQLPLGRNGHFRKLERVGKVRR